MPAIFMLRAFDSLVIACCVTHLYVRNFYRQSWNVETINVKTWKLLSRSRLTFSQDPLCVAAQGKFNQRTKARLIKNIIQIILSSNLAGW